MAALDETDLRTLDLLAADARRPYSDIADDVGLSAPALLLFVVSGSFRGALRATRVGGVGQYA